VPEISRFFGIVIAMYHDDHQPPRGKFPPRALGLVLEWWSLHQSELADNWQVVSSGREPARINPLE
jgi:hypothetical protein